MSQNQCTEDRESRLTSKLERRRDKAAIREDGPAVGGADQEEIRSSAVDTLGL